MAQAAAGGGAAGVALSTLTVQQLSGLKNSLENDIQRYAESAQFFNKSASIYFSTNSALQELGESKEGQPLLLPLTQSLYVSGKVASVNQVLVDVGTGYFVEMTTEQGQEYCKRRVDKLKVASEEVQQLLGLKQRQLMQVEKELQNKMAVAQQQQQKA